MTARNTSCAWMLAILTLVGLTVGSAKADTTYFYTGTPFTNCTFGPCPAGFTSDYLLASISFAAPLASNLPYSAETPTAWTLKDALGTFSYSSITTPTYLTGFPSESVPPLALATDGSGNIVAYGMFSAPAEVLGISGLSEAFLLNPPVVDPESPVPLASVIEAHVGSSAEWDAVSGTPGTWSTPEPSTLLLSLCGIFLVFATAWKSRKRASPTAP